MSPLILILSKLQCCPLFSQNDLLVTFLASLVTSLISSLISCTAMTFIFVVVVVYMLNAMLLHRYIWIDYEKGVNTIKYSSKMLKMHNHMVNFVYRPPQSVLGPAILLQHVPVFITFVKLQPKSLVKRLGVDFVFTPSRLGSQPHKKRVLASNLGS